MKQRRGVYIGLLVLLLMMLIGSGLAVFFLNMHRDDVAATTHQVVGHAFFVSSGQLNEGNSQGNNDELQIELQTCLPPLMARATMPGY